MINKVLHVFAFSLCNLPIDALTPESSSACTKQADQKSFSSLLTKSVKLHHSKMLKDMQTESRNGLAHAWSSNQLMDTDLSIKKPVSNTYNIEAVKMDSIWSSRKTGVAQELNGSVSTANDSDMLNRRTPQSRSGNGTVPLNPNKFPKYARTHPIEDGVLILVLVSVFSLLALLFCSIKWDAESSLASRNVSIRTLVSRNVSISTLPRSAESAADISSNSENQLEEEQRKNTRLKSNEKHEKHKKVLKDAALQLKLSLICHRRLVSFYRKWYYCTFIPALIISACVPIAEVAVPVRTNWTWLTREVCVVVLGCISTILVGISNLDETKSSMQKHQRAVDNLLSLLTRWRGEVELPVKFEGASPALLFAEFKPTMMNICSKMLEDDPLFIGIQHNEPLYETLALDPASTSIDAAAPAKVKAPAAEAAAVAADGGGSDMQDDDRKNYCQGLHVMREKLLAWLDLHQQARKEYKIWYLVYAIPTFLITACAPIVAAVFRADESTRQLLVLALGCISTILVGMGRLEDNQSLMEEHSAAIKTLSDLLCYYNIEIDTPVRLHMLQPREAYYLFKKKFLTTSDLITVPLFIYEKNLEKERELQGRTGNKIHKLDLQEDSDSGISDDDDESIDGSQSSIFGR